MRACMRVWKVCKQGVHVNTIQFAKRRMAQIKKRKKEQSTNELYTKTKIKMVLNIIKNKGKCLVFCSDCPLYDKCIKLSVNFVPWEHELLKLSEEWLKDLL